MGSPAIDLSHHLSLLSKSRHPSPLKDIIHYMHIPGMISLAGGLPHPSLFPFHSLSASAYPPSTVLDPISPSPPTSSVDYTITRDQTSTSPYHLTAGLQYSSPSGHASLLAFARALTSRLYPPAFSDWDVLMNGGSTDAWTKIVALLVERGESILCEAQIYPSAQAAFIPLGISAVPVAVDGEGLRADALDEILGAWDEKARGTKQPRVMYLVPVGQNPLGSTMGIQRRQAIYDVCVKYDVVIIEDDPYTMLQFTPYTLGSSPEPPAASANVDEFITTVVKSFLTLDVQGRVIRLDTFSKTLAPGSRLGWFTANKMFIERLLRGTEVQTQHPSGFSQMIIGQLLENWGLDGYLEWVTNLKEQYRVRRDWMLSSLTECFDIIPAETSGIPGALGLVAYPRGNNATPIMSFMPPTGGMFIWCTVYYNSHPRFSSYAEGKEEPEAGFEREFWKTLADALVLVTPGWYYTPWEGEAKVPARERGVGHFRLAFSYEGKSQMDEGVRRLAEVMTREWTTAAEVSA